MPKDQNDGVDTDSIRKRDAGANISRPPDKPGLNGNAEARPNLLSSAATREDVDIRFGDPIAVDAPCVLKCPDVPVVEVGPGV